MTSRARALAIHTALLSLYPAAHCTLDYATPFHLLCATILAAQCTDKRVNMITPALFAKYPTPYDLTAAPQADVEHIIHAAGFYRHKAKNLIACAKRLCDDYGGEVPDNMDALITLPGVGRKTANVILGEVYNKPAIVVDTHAGRLSRRMGLTKATDPTQVERDLSKILPPDISFQFCHLLVYHGREVCTARKPGCGDCAINDICPKVLIL